MLNELITVTDLSGNCEPIASVSPTLERTVNGEKILSFRIFQTLENEYSFPLIQEESEIEFLGEKYIIKQANYKPKGKTYFKTVVAYHKFFCDMSDQRIYESYTQSFTFRNAVKVVFDNSGYTYEIVDEFYAEDWENFGKDNRLALFQDVLNRYGAEFEIVSQTHIRLKKRIGNQTDFQFRFNFNIKTLDYQIDTKSLATYIKGTGKDGITAEYTSPNASIFGIRDAEEVDDDRYTTVSGLTERLKSDLSQVDKPIISITVDFIDLRKAGFPFQIPNCGDDVYLIHEPMGLDLTVRIVSITEEFDVNLNPIKTSVTLGNIRNTVASSFDQASKTIDSIFDGNGKIKFSFLDEAVKRATQDIQNSQTEIEYSNGFIAREKTDTNKLVVFNSGGLGVSTDGGVTFKNAITANGVVAEAINAGTMRSIILEASEMYGGLLLSKNSTNTKWNLDTGKLQMENANFELSGSALIEFLDARNKIAYEKYDADTSTRRTAGIGFTDAINERFPLVYMGTSVGDKYGFGAIDENSFTGFIANTNRREFEDGIGNSVVGDIFQIRDKAIAFTRGFTYDLNGTTVEFKPLNSGTYQYNMGASNNHFNKLYLSDSIHTPRGRFDVESTSTPNQGFSFITNYDGEPQLTFRGKHADEFYRLGTDVFRWSYIYLKYQPDVTSDERQKEEILDNTLGLDFIRDIKTKTFKLINTNKNLMKEPIQYGVIAQDLRDNLINKGVNVDDINLLSLGSNGMYSVQYNQLIPPTIKAVQELDDKSTATEERLSNIELTLQDILTRLEFLENGTTDTTTTT
ncbi:phage tail spike protein [Metabacillus halosaccharovorans]|uniref:phage tail spike protein n=1 Tax=Metabacillus halosaccharovorans TaxID=930124 RepID=UPI00203D8672|nr:phage tail spike protein [Metabacillus halosaccharovorans]MCM3444391.1 phage tail protein [Metabacillus halosaccharovorans]